MDEQNQIVEVIPQFTSEDFLDGQKPFEYIYSFKSNPLKMQQIINKVAERAKEVDVKNFKDLLKGYKKSVSNAASIVLGEETNFSGQEMKLKCGQYEANDYGITTYTRNGTEIVCGHPIMPVERYRNIDSGAMRIKLAYKRSGYWDSVIVPRVNLVDKRKILSLAEVGIDVNSENAGHLVKYLSEVENLNYDNIPEKRSVSRLGWVGNDLFVPYMDGIIFDGEETYRGIYESIQPTGSFEKWIAAVKNVRSSAGIAVKLALASSFSSVLIAKIGTLPFFVHFWGNTETGKTVALLLAASVWANPELGAYAKTFDSTGVGQEFVAGFLNSLPVIFDELQLRKNRNAEEVVYKLAEGVGRLRGNKDGGLQRTATWKNCIITSGECPISGENAGGGAKNRAINIECNDSYLFDNPEELCGIIKRNYGYAGKMFVTWLEDKENLDKAIKIYKEFSAAIEESQSTDKQRAAASVILTADKLIDEIIFHDGYTIDMNEFIQLLQTKDDVSAEKAAYNYLLDMLAINEQHFDGSKFTEVWGVIDKEYDCTCIVKTVFDRMMNDGGFNPQAVLSWLRRNDKIVTQAGKSTRVKKIGKRSIRCVYLKHSEMADIIDNLEECCDEELPESFR